MATAKRQSDLPAALTGLVLGAVSIFLVVIVIVLLTNNHFEKEKASHAAKPAGAAPAAAH